MPESRRHSEAKRNVQDYGRRRTLSSQGVAESYLKITEEEEVDFDKQKNIQHLAELIDRLDEIRALDQLDTERRKNVIENEEVKETKPYYGLHCSFV